MIDTPTPSRELLNLVAEYEKLTNQCDFGALKPYIAEDAVYWFSNGTYVGIEQIEQAVEATWATIQNEKYTISNIQWLVATDHEAAYMYNFHSDGIVNGQRQQYDGRGTNILRKIDSRWKIIHEHLSKNL